MSWLILSLLCSVHLDILRLVVTLGEGGQQRTRPECDQQRAQHQTSDVGQSPIITRADQSLQNNNCHLNLRVDVLLYYHAKNHGGPIKYVDATEEMLASKALHLSSRGP